MSFEYINNFSDLSPPVYSDFTTDPEFYGLLIDNFLEIKSLNCVGCKVHREEVAFQISHTLDIPHTCRVVSELNIVYIQQAIDNLLIDGFISNRFHIYLSENWSAHINLQLIPLYHVYPESPPPSPLSIEEINQLDNN